MAKAVKVEKDKFEAVLRKMIDAKPTPRVDLPKSKRKLRQIEDPATIH